MKLQLSALVLLGFLLCAVNAEKSAQLKGRRSSYFNEPTLAKFRSEEAPQLADAAAVDEGADTEKAGVASASSTGNKDASSGRLFLKKFLLFKNMFGQSQQPVIPIIITGAGTGTGTASPTATITSTGTIPSATGTITTSPTTTATSGREYGAEQDDEQDNGEEESEGAAGAAELVDEQTLQAALAAGAQEYEVITDKEVHGTGSTESKATQPSRINLRRKGNRRGQVISVRIPPRYRRYFKNGQRVMLNTNSRPYRKRVIRKRVQNNRRRGGNKNKKNKGKRTRITGV
ncbi:uncharacterized protein LOC115633369 [Scaptodrosophila lebanonensis]|uniref:Uncharacterized protein LOC115633369 n=1 Tax=Drosophila lebanonensis TaxID=7225 RepID=A0A6J2UE93_DROLE|nr:uncharacterized protein LOC115633369 [Scaptodrosophila lebanonensis]